MILHRATRWAVGALCVGIVAATLSAPAQAITLPPSTASGVVGMNKNATAVRECPQTKVVVGVRAENRAHTGTQSTGVLIRFDLWCASITITNGVPNVVHDGGLTTFPKVPSNAPGDNAAQTVTCPANMVVTGLGGNVMNRSSTWYWPTTAIIVCSPVVITPNGELGFDTTPANQVTLTAGKPITNITNRIDGPFCGPSDGTLTRKVIRGYRPQAGGEAMDGFITSCLVNGADDFGDAPTSYGNAPAGADGAVQLGATLDAETTPQIASEANGDDIASGSSPNQKFDDEDSVAVLPEIEIGRDDNASIQVTASNRLSIPATVMAWIDLNRNGTFDAPEAQQASLSANTIDSTLTLNWTGINSQLAGNAGYSYLRVRISSDPALTASNAAIRLGNGETEDYRITLTEAAPALNLVKTAAQPNDLNSNDIFGDAGDTVPYTLIATNSGDLPLESVVINDPLLGGQLANCIPSAPAILPVGASMTCTGSYTVLQSDVDAAMISNTATATGVTALGANITSPPATSTLNVPFLGSLTLTKTSNAPPTVNAGTLVTYTLTATNNGVVSANDVRIDDPLPGLAALSCTPAAGSTLAPGESLTCTADYLVTQADIDVGQVSNTATATGTDTQANPLRSSTGLTIRTNSIAEAGISVSADTSGLSAPPVAGNVIAYQFTASNTGTQTLTGVDITTSLPGLSALTYTWPGTPGVLTPGQSATATATYALLQADLDAGLVSLSAELTGSAISGTAVTARSSQDTPLTQVPGLTISKTGSLAGSGVPGDTVTYTFVMSNTGNVTMSGFVLEDALPNLTAITPGPWPDVPGQLGPGTSVTYTAQYLVTQADVDGGSVSNTIAISGIDPNGEQTLATASADIPLDSRADISLTTSINTATLPAVPRQGDTVSVAYLVQNTGTQTLSGVVISDTAPGLGPLSYSWPGTAGVLGPGEQATATAQLTLNQATIDAGQVDSSASVTGESATAAVATASATDSVPLTQVSTLTVSLIANADATSDPPVPGEQISYRTVVVNTGNVTLTSVDITHSLAGIDQSRVITWPGVAGTLPPGQIVTSLSSYSIAQADIDAGSVTNTVTVTGVSPLGPLGPRTSTATVALPAIGVLTLDKTTDAVDTVNVGDLITYTFVITNTGPLTINGVTLTDPLPGLSAITLGPWPNAEGTLAPGEQVSASAVYTVTAADSELGQVTNVASVAGTDSHLGMTTASDTVTVDVTPPAPPVTPPPVTPPPGISSPPTLNVPLSPLPRISLAQTGTQPVGIMLITVIVSGSLGAVLLGIRRRMAQHR